MNNTQAQFQAVKGHCALVFDTLIAKLYKKVAPEWPEDLPDTKSPLFVTYYKGKTPIPTDFRLTFFRRKESQRMYRNLR